VPGADVTRRLTSVPSEGARSSTSKPIRVAPLVTRRVRYRLLPERSAVLIEARSNVGPFAFGSTELAGYMEITVDESSIDVDAAPVARLAVQLDTLRSGNSLYDAELLRRIDARTYPETIVELTSAARIGTSDRYQASGDITFHGITKSISGTVTASVARDGRIVIVGEHSFDIRDFDVAAPTVLMLRIYPDVRVQLQLEGEPLGNGDR
jgi:polyisoprenoid-binding protein YceI